MSRMFILDCESLGTTDMAIILSIGMTYIEPGETVTLEDLVKRGWYAKLNRREQAKLGRTVDADTLSWWEQQGKEAKEVLSEIGCALYETWAPELNCWCRDNGVLDKDTIIMSRGLIDGKWLESLGKSFNAPETSALRFPFWRYRDTRTALDLLSGSPNGPKIQVEGFIKHHALYDAAMDGLRLLTAFNG